MRAKRAGGLLGDRRGGVFKSALALLVFASAAGTLGWMLLMPSALRSEVEARTGFPVDYKTLACNPLGFSFHGEGITVGNPGRFGGEAPAFEIERIDVSMSLPALARGEIWLDRLEIHIRRATLVVDESGQYNLQVFLERLFAKEGGGTTPFFAESARLTIDELSFIDNSQIVPTRRQLRPRLDLEYRDLERPEKLLEPVNELGRSVGGLKI
ncbi:hypothetical protein [Pelagicoccus sp. SDUM812003]|uniref:hypothetical protein n=1 Tax=Pelagicoccus sp. SDUM812003 TaxID=3041267 RepID=UPI0028103AD6|nr:hypothetical protein [Pelagicoccus sp. SDUM812003]MDQ8203858.1 hypothetical protein [Pelagicoccus sp. SDUM812003]